MDTLLESIIQSPKMNRIAEYWLVDPEIEEVEQYVLESNRCTLGQKGGHSLVNSVAVTGFTILVRAILDEQENTRVLQTLLANN